MAGKPRGRGPSGKYFHSKSTHPKEWQLEFDLRRHYNMSIHDYNEMFEEQKGCCAICLKHQTEFKQRLHVDHCHTTNKIRKLLCQKCNHGIGLFNDNPEVLKRAVAYLGG